jgi:alpha-tubulin suppressor-like RCC1 family protein
MDDSTVACWGDNTQGQLGQGPAGPDSSATPLFVKKAANALLPYTDAVMAGGETTCVLRLASQKPLACWGRNDYGQAGQPSSMPIVSYAMSMSL